MPSGGCSAGEEARMIEFKLPSLGSDMDEGKLLEWRVKPGDRVKRGDVVAVVDTSKAAVDVEIWQEGVVQSLLVQPGETVPVGTVLAILAEEGQPAAAEPVAAPAPARRPVSPLARKRARELGVDIERIDGTGPSGSVTEQDVERAAGASAPADRQAQMRQAIAAAMSRSKREIPHYYLAETIPLAAASAWLQACNAERPVTGRLLMAVLQLKAVALACRKFADMNGFWRDGRFAASGAVHPGVAISLRSGGLIAPAIHDAADKPLEDLMRDLTDLVRRARAGSLRSSELSEPTITVTNLGEQGVESVFGVIYPPQVALVGFGRIAERPWVENGNLVVRPALSASLSADHRVSDGHRGALFLTEIRELLQHPERL
jgi:pyruvate dehydrogenase E2 component (dihydrolipoamide acetyltransferase)